MWYHFVGGKGGKEEVSIILYQNQNYLNREDLL
jgi:hypothetical protein